MAEYQKYINALRKCAKEHENDRTSTGHIIVSDLCKDTANLLEELEQEPRWIPVSERLPEEREWYLAVFKEIDTGYQLIPRVADYIGNGENKWRIIDEDGLVQEYRSILECVAWMPLPKPYNM